MLPLFFRHYDSLVDRYFIHDNQSSDRSLEILAAHPRVTVLPLHLDGDSLCQAAFEQVNTFWKPSVGSADWVAVCNVDEFFWHPDLPWYLRQCRKRGITWIPTRGWEMVGDDFPSPDEHLPTTRRAGVRHPPLDKPSFFNPSAITDSGFGMARHVAAPVGRVVVPERCEMQLLHYKHLGFEYTVRRQAELGERMRALDRKKKWGFHYEAALVEASFRSLRAAAVTVAAPARGQGHGRGDKWQARMPRPLHRS
jgi:Glycosyl transferase family 2